MKIVLAFLITAFYFCYVTTIRADASYDDYLYEKFYGTNIEDYPVNHYSLSHHGFNKRHLHRSPHRGGHSLYRSGHDYERSTHRDGQGHHYPVYHYDPYTGIMKFEGFDFYNRREYWEK